MSLKICMLTCKFIEEPLVRN